MFVCVCVCRGGAWVKQECNATNDMTSDLGTMRRMSDIVSVEHNQVCTGGKEEKIKSKVRALCHS